MRQNRGVSIKFAMAAVRPKTEVAALRRDVCFSNQPIHQKAMPVILTTSLKLGRRPCLSIRWPEFAFNVAAQPTMSVELALAA
jgi:hypothetical protein